MGLIDELKKEHIELLDFLSKLLKVHNPQERFDLLQKSKEKLIAHLKKEDEKLYPVLNKKAKEDHLLETMLRISGTEMEDISKFVDYFYSTYYDINLVRSKSFANDLGKFYVMLKNRIMNEEISLYREYENLIKE
jgi:hypothetical protein